MNSKILLSLIVSSTLLSACSKSSGGGGKPVSLPPSKNVDSLETEMYGTYQAIFAPLNTTVSGHLAGSLTLVREREDFIADVRLSGAPSSTMHTQTIHIGTTCPTEADDFNHDGYVDGEEAALSHQEVLIPLDDDISSQWMGLGTYPVTDEFGYYFWSRATRYDKIMSDLRDEDINHTDEYAKIGSEKSLTVGNKVVMVRGIPESVPLPETVKGYGRLTPHQSLPIACGVIHKLLVAPGKLDTDQTNIPVPEGETIGGSSGVDDGADFNSTPPTTTGGNYGEDDEGEVITHSNEVTPETSGGTSSGN